MKERKYVCGIGPAFDVIGGKWKALLLCELREGAVRYGELKRRVEGISEKVLTEQLRELEQDGLVVRRVLNQVPPFVEYSLTEWGQSLHLALGPVADWGEAFAKATGRYPDDSGGAKSAGGTVLEKNRLR